MYGEQNASLSYLSHIQARGVRLSEIPRCGHFPMYSNPAFMWREIGEFLCRGCGYADASSTSSAFSSLMRSSS
jgi:pimeloyl-ACP methyl ester carboxylesterase